ncbi:HAD family hydrolase [Hydromonas duriensis]|uniref:Phosphoglycolate phosphatase n=1 Tax=Hydromonas duriensis TaxID=1527608 RepID=A0A4V6PY45_9BURK|nr:HAD-IA family hydrolase [Hydromonas duriensis]TDR32336.1 phosphoglycolate phosphatase [Hydromonas duriensis]
MTLEKLSQARLVIFDWDGTLFDSTGVIAYSLQRSCEALGFATPTLKQAKHVIGLDFKEVIAYLVGDLDAQQTAEFMRVYRSHYLTSESIVTLYDGVIEVLKDLRGHNRLAAIATGKSRVGLDRVLEQGHLRTYFQATRTADQTSPKPHPLMLQELLDELDIHPHEAVMVGDTTYDVEMAHAAGVSSIAVCYGAHDERQLQAAQPSAIAHSVSDLAVLLGVMIKA